MPISVLLVDDDPLVRTGLRMMLGGASDITIVGEVDDGDAVEAAVHRLNPTVVLMDIRMARVDGITATRILNRSQAPPQVIVLTTFDADTKVIDALRAGAVGYLVKHTEPEQIVAAVRRAAAGEPVLSPEVARTLISHVTKTGDTRQARARERFAELSPREREVAIAVAEGLSNTEIAERLYMSVGTVKAHVSSALTKLDLTGRIQLALVTHDATS